MLGQNELVLQQITGMTSNDFEITDPQERMVGRVETLGSAAGRLLKGSRALMLTEAVGTELLSILDPMDLGLDRYELRSPDGSQLIGHLQRRMSLLGTRASIDLGDRQLMLEGSWPGKDFRLMLDQTVAASVSRCWAGLGRGLLGRSRYQVSIHPEAPPRDRLAILGGIVALDLIRAKADRG